MLSASRLRWAVECDGSSAMAIIPCLRRIIERMVVPSSRGTDNSIVAQPGGMFQRPAAGSSTSPNSRVRSRVCRWGLDASLMPLNTDATANRFELLLRSRPRVVLLDVMGGRLIGRDFGTVRTFFAPVELGRVRCEYQRYWFRARLPC